jgi:peptidyl-prolyl cis-trans isomerase SurA
MKRLFILLLLIASFGIIQAEVVDKVIARIGDDIILMSDLVKQVNQMKNAKMLKEGTQESEILAQMIESRLIIQKAKELNYTVDEAKIKASAEKQVRQVKARFDSEEAYQLEIRKMKLTNSDIMKYFVDTMTEQALSQQFYQKQVQTKANVTDKEMLDFYEANKDTLAIKPVTYEIGMIIRQATASEATDKAQYNAIKAIQDSLKAGVSFETLARRDSECPSKEVGGDLGFIAKGQLVKPFEDAAFALKTGEVSDIVKTQYGYHVIKMEEKRGEEIRVRHILRLVQASHQDSLNSRAQMEDIRNQFIAGKSFAALATQWSQDEESAKDGGSIGEYGAADYPELFAPVLSSLQVGKISEVLENEGTYYLFLKMTEIPSRMLTFEEVRTQVKDLLTRQKQMTIYDEWVEQLKNENHIEIML